jgi:hypothetical protein
LTSERLTEWPESIEIYRVNNNDPLAPLDMQFYFGLLLFVPILDADPDRFVPFAAGEWRIFASIRSVPSLSHAILLRNGPKQPCMPALQRNAESDCTGMPAGDLGQAPV